MNNFLKKVIEKLTQDERLEIVKQKLDNGEKLEGISFRYNFPCYGNKGLSIDGFSSIDLALDTNSIPKYRIKYPNQ